jgi:hypothetical protein
LTPHSIAGHYLSGPFTTFGPTDFAFNGTLVKADPITACSSDFNNKDELVGKIAFVTGKYFYTKYIVLTFF